MAVGRRQSERGLRACLVTFFNQVKLTRWAVKNPPGPTLWFTGHPDRYPPGGSRLFSNPGGFWAGEWSQQLKVEPGWSPRVSRDYTAKSRIDCAILAKSPTYIAGGAYPLVWQVFHGLFVYARLISQSRGSVLYGVEASSQCGCSAARALAP